ncbi:MAG TPA: NUDIX hydrolase [Candidatus Saccharimonadales bacterium]|nr:NUDIX hydrolase [Candidatus Saccharimonadales bacterium]
MVKFADEETDLRRGIDHIGVSVCGIIHDGEGNILLMKRGAKARDEQGRWDICGGALEFGESIDEAMRREIKEELCTEALDMEFVHAYEAHREHQGNKTHWIALVHVVRVDPQTVKIGEPHKIDKIAWFTEATLPSPRHSMFPKALEAAKRAGVIT